MSAIEVYKKIPIYRDDTSNDIFLYRRKHGKGRVNFPNLKECKKYIDNHCEDIECAKNVVLKNITAGCHGKPKKSVKASESEWPEELTYDDYDEGDQLMEGFVEAVDELGLFEEPSGYGSTFTDYFYDDNYNELAHIGGRSEKNALMRAYNKSTSREHYKELVKVWLKKLCKIKD